MARYRSSLMQCTNLRTGRIYFYIEKCDVYQRVSQAEYAERYAMLYTPDGTLESIHSKTTKTHRRDYCTVVWSEETK